MLGTRSSGPEAPGSADYDTPGRGVQGFLFFPLFLHVSSSVIWGQKFFMGEGKQPEPMSSHRSTQYKPLTSAFFGAPEQIPTSTKARDPENDIEVVRCLRRSEREINDVSPSGPRNLDQNIPPNV